MSLLNKDTNKGVGKHSAQSPETDSSGMGRHGQFEHEAEWQEIPHKRRFGKVIAILAAVLVVLAGGAYLAGVAVFSNVMFLPGTSINGEDVSLLHFSDVSAAHSELADGYVLSVSGQGLDFTVPAANVDLKTDGATYVSDAQAQVDAWKWPMLAFERRDLTVDTSATFDGTKVDRLVGSAVESANEAATPPVDAEVTLDEKTGTYVVTGGVAGTELDAMAIIEMVSKALRVMEPTVTVTEAQLVMPEVTADDEALNAEAETLNSYLGATQTLTVKGAEVRTIDGTQLSKWIVVGDDRTVTMDADAVTKWARGELSEELDSIGSTRAYTRPDGKAVEVSGGTYGWSIDGASLASEIVSNVEEGKAATVEIPMLQTAAAWNPGGVDWGARYIDIDLAEQYVRLYDDAGALVWESACVSGKTSDGHDTPTGVYSINGNMASGNVELRGKIDPATNEPEYISYVTYWMPFIENAVALHDASWRSSFGGTIYQDSGSHGCVNLPSDAAERLYGMVHVGDVVVVHG